VVDAGEFCEIKTISPHQTSNVVTPSAFVFNFLTGHRSLWQVTWAPGMGFTIFEQRFQLVSRGGSWTLHAGPNAPLPGVIFPNSCFEQRQSAIQFTMNSANSP